MSLHEDHVTGYALPMPDDEPSQHFFVVYATTLLF